MKSRDNGRLKKLFTRSTNRTAWILQMKYRFYAICQKNRIFVKRC
nr:MAG TPA: hypothetical protein [Caudoviricetes sp.]